MTPFDITTASLEPGVTLIEASAGTGKTFSITGLILRLVLEKHLEIRSILAVTFTEAATQELRDRVRRRLQAALEDLRRGGSKDPIVDAFLKKGDISTGLRELDLALQSFDEAQIFTIHGFCQRMLNDYAFESGARFDTALLTDPKPLFLEVARDFWRLRFYRAKPLLPTLAMAWEKSPDDWVALLEQTGRHPDLVILPPTEPKSGEKLLDGVRLAFAAASQKGCREKDHPLESPRLVEKRKYYVGEPLPGEPRLGGLRERENVGLRDGVVGKNPLPCADMDPGPCILEQPRWRARNCKQQQPQQQRHEQQVGKTRRGDSKASSCGGGNVHRAI